MCFMEIPERARKCPHCLHFQNRLSLIMFHPAVHATLLAMPLLLFLLFIEQFRSLWLDTGEDYQTYSDQIEITESEILFGELDTGPSVSVIGTIQNRSPVPWKRIRFQVDFLNADGKRIDTGQTEQWHSYRVPPGRTMSFKATFQREFAEADYVAHTISVVSAEDARVKSLW